MSRFEESHSSDFEQSVQLGKDNAICLSHMRSWCEHVDIEETTRGLYAEFTGLPIGAHRIACAKVTGEWESMNLRSMFTDFLTQFCAGCSFHSPIGDPSWGRAIIDERERAENERRRVAASRAEQASRLRNELRSKAKGIARDVQPESSMTLNYLVEVFSEDEEESNKAAVRLKQSVRLGPDIIPDAGLELILLLAGLPDYSCLMLPVCEELARSRVDLCPDLMDVALSNIAKRLHIESSAAILNALGDQVPYPLKSEHLEVLLLDQDGLSLERMMVSTEPISSHITAVLVRSFDADPDGLQEIARHALQNTDDQVRMQLCSVIQLIQQQRPTIALGLLKDLLRSLDIYEQERSQPAPSSQIARILKSAFLQSPEVVDRGISAQMSQVRPAVQGDLVRVYTVADDRTEPRKSARSARAQGIAIRRLILWIQEDQLALQTRIDAVTALQEAYKGISSIDLSDLETILGYLAIVSSQKEPPSSRPALLLPDQLPSPGLEEFQAMSETYSWGAFKHGLLECLKVLCGSRPSEALELVAACFDQPVELTDSSFRAYCAVLLGQIGQDYLIRPRVMPFIWKALMDYNSPLTRAYAVDAVVQIFPVGTLPPDNLVDVIVLHLQDPKVVVHQAALNAVKRRSAWFDGSRSVKVLACLLEHIRVYRHDRSQLPAVCEAIARMGRKDSRLREAALKAVESVLPVGEKYADREIVEELMHLCQPNEECAELVARAVSEYLRLYHRDHYNDYQYTERRGMFDWLHKLPMATFEQVSGDLESPAREVAKRDSWESGCFASLFASFGEFGHEREVLRAAVDALPEEPRYEPERSVLEQLANAAEANASLQESET